MKKTTILLCAFAATFAITAMSCKKGDFMSPGAAAGASVPKNETHYSACDTATNTRKNLDTGKPCRCEL